MKYSSSFFRFSVFSAPFKARKSPNQFQAFMMSFAALRQCQLCEDSDGKEMVQIAVTSTMSKKSHKSLSKCWMAFTGKKDAKTFAEDIKWLCRNCAFEFRASYEERHSDNRVETWWEKTGPLEEAYSIFKEMELNQLPNLTFERNLIAMPAAHKEKFFEFKQGSLICNFCARLFHYTNNLIQHVQLAHPNNINSKILRSVGRGKMNTYPVRLGECISTFRNCHDCGRSFVNKSSLKEHFLKAHIKLPQRQIDARSCALELKFTKQRNKEIQSVAVFRCDYNKCFGVFVSKSKLKAHIKIKHLNHPVKVTNLAPLRSITEQLQKNDQHDLDVEQEQTVKPQCTLCLKQYSSFANVRCHIRKIHPELGKEGCPFVHCTFFCFSRAQLQLHYKNAHHADGPLFCDRCNFRAQYLGLLRWHMLSHDQFKVVVDVEVRQASYAPVSNVSRCPHCGWMKMVKYMASHCQGSVCSDCASAFPCKGLEQRHECPNKKNKKFEQINLKLKIDF